MSSNIKTYNDLLQEEQRLLAKLKVTEALIKEDIAGIKEGLKPLNNVIATIKKFTTRDRVNPLVNFGLDFSIDLVIRRLILARAGWIAKVVIPYIVKNYSSHIINEEKRSMLVKKIQQLFNKIRPKPDAKPEQQTETTGS